MKNRYFDELKEIGITEEEEEIPEENLLPFSETGEKERVRKTVRAVLFVMLGLLAVETAVVLFFVGGPVSDWTHGKWQALLGLFIGVALAVLWFLTIRHEIERATEEPEMDPHKKIRIGTILRYLALLAILAGAFLTGWANPILILIGMLNLKVAAYASGFFNKQNA